jgi:hypothetical protein
MAPQEIKFIGTYEEFLKITFGNFAYAYKADHEEMDKIYDCATKKAVRLCQCDGDYGDYTHNILDDDDLIIACYFYDKERSSSTLWEEL